MPLIKPSIIESMFHAFLALDASRPHYYKQLINMTFQIFYFLNHEDKVKELNDLLVKEVEIPFQSSYYAILEAFYIEKFMWSRKAFCKIGDGIDTVYVTRPEIQYQLEIVKDWCTREIWELSHQINFTDRLQLVG